MFYCMYLQLDMVGEKLQYLMTSHRVQKKIPQYNNRKTYAMVVRFTVRYMSLQEQLELIA